MLETVRMNAGAIESLYRDLLLSEGSDFLSLR